jgi:hypothetical protein
LNTRYLRTNGANEKLAQGAVGISWRNWSTRCGKYWIKRDHEKLSTRRTGS